MTHTSPDEQAQRTWYETLDTALPSPSEEIQHALQMIQALAEALTHTLGLPPDEQTIAAQPLNQAIDLVAKAVKVQAVLQEVWRYRQDQDDDASDTPF